MNKNPIVTRINKGLLFTLQPVSELNVGIIKLTEVKNLTDIVKFIR